MIHPDSIRSAETVLNAITDVSRAELAVATYETAAGMEGGAQIQVWHLLFSLMDLCEAQRTNFDTILQSAQAAFATEVAGKPDSQILFLLFDLMGFCKAQDIDFASIITDIRAERPMINQ